MTPELQVVGEQHRDLIAGLDHPERGDVVRFGAPVRDEYLVRCRPRVQGGDPLAQGVSAVRLAVPEPHVEQRVRGRLGEREQLAHAQRMHARLRQVVANPVFPGALPALEIEGDEWHQARDAMSRGCSSQ